MGYWDNYGTAAGTISFTAGWSASPQIRGKISHFREQLQKELSQICPKFRTKEICTYRYALGRGTAASAEPQKKRFS